MIETFKVKHEAVRTELRYLKQNKQINKGTKNIKTLNSSQSLNPKNYI